VWINRSNFSQDVRDQVDSVTKRKESIRTLDYRMDPILESRRDGGGDTSRDILENYVNSSLTNRGLLNRGPPLESSRISEEHTDRLSLGRPGLSRRDASFDRSPISQWDDWHDLSVRFKPNLLTKFETIRRN